LRRSPLIVGVKQYFCNRERRTLKWAGLIYSVPNASRQFRCPLAAITNYAIVAERRTALWKVVVAVLRAAMDGSMRRKMNKVLPQ